MKNVFKIFSILLVFLVSLSILTGCSKKEQNDTNKTSDTKETTNNDTNESVNDGKGEIYLLLNTEGLGQVAYYIDETRNVEFDDEYPSQQAYIRLDGETKATIKAKANEDYKFVKWTKDGKEYSTDEELEITITGATELTAVFESN